MVGEQSPEVAFDREQASISRNFRENNKFERLVNDETKRTWVTGERPNTIVLSLEFKLSMIAEQLGSKEKADYWNATRTDQLALAASVDGFLVKERNTGRYFSNQQPQPLPSVPSTPQVVNK